MGSGFRKRPGTSKVASYFSHDFIIQNHGDIATCFCMVFIIGLMFQATTPLASAFIAPKYNVTEMNVGLPVLYTYGYKDMCLTFFYTITAVIFHAIIQEYVLDKLMRKVRLSKMKANKFNESGQLMAFYAVSVVWMLVIFRDEGYFQSLNFFWVGYPHVGLTFMTKFIFIIQISYWLHQFPELYFQKVKREDASDKIVFALLNMFISTAIYVLNLTRIGLTLLFIDYAINGLFHFSRLMYFMGRENVSRVSFKVYNILFPVARLTQIILSIFVFWFGLTNSSVDRLNLEEGNFNTPLTRLTCVGVSVVLLTWMLWNFILFHFKKLRENAKSQSTSKASKQPAKKVKVAREGSDSEVELRQTATSNGDAGKQKTN